MEGLAGYGMAMEFDGESYVDCGNDARLDITGPISMAIWIRPGTDGSVETVPLCKADASAGWRSDWIGAIDDVRIYDRASSEAEVLELASKQHRRSRLRKT